MVVEKSNQLNHNGFLYFDTPIKSDSKSGSSIKVEINRVNKGSPYQKEQILPVTYAKLKGDCLLEIYHRIKNNEFYVYKKLKDGKEYKIRLKK